MPSDSQVKNFDGFLFFLVIFVGLVLAIHGKSITNHIFNGDSDWLRERRIGPHLICFLAAFMMQYIRSKNFALRLRMGIASPFILLFVIFIHIASTSPSVLVFTIQLVLLISALAVIALEPYMSEKSLDREFWKLILESAMRAIRYGIMLYIAGFALLKFLSDNVNEEKSSFLTSFMYPTIMMVICVFIVGYWLAIPSWEKLVESYQKND